MKYMNYLKVYIQYTDHKQMQLNSTIIQIVLRQHQNSLLCFQPVRPQGLPFFN
jgi:hypothetical protein